MTHEIARTMLQVPLNEDTWQVILEHPASFIWDEHGEQVDDWNRLVAAPAGLPDISVSTNDDGEVVYHYRDRSVEVLFLDERGDNLIGIHTIGQLVYPDAELRFCRDSSHSSDVAFLSLTPAQWSELEAEFGMAAVALRFLKLDPDLDTFLDPGRKKPDDASTGQPGSAANTDFSPDAAGSNYPVEDAYTTEIMMAVVRYFPGMVALSDVDPGKLRVLFQVTTDRERDALLGHALLRSELDAIVARVRASGIAVNGIRAESRETMRREKLSIIPFFSSNDPAYSMISPSA